MERGNMSTVQVERSSDPLKRTAGAVPAIAATGFFTRAVTDAPSGSYPLQTLCPKNHAA
jgi:hypothetical protein